MNLDQYQTLIFDCDGVILNSNKLKTQAFYQATLPYGESKAQAMVDYHVQNGGISRYCKFEYFLEQIMGVRIDPQELENLLITYAKFVREGLMGCEIAQGIHELRQATSHARWLVVSGGDQAELRDIFVRRGLSSLFDGGIFGSPDSKDEILLRELTSGNIKQPAVFLGDSRYDHQAAVKARLDFIFVSAWTEFIDWKSYILPKDVVSVNSMIEIMKVNNLWLS